MKLLMALMLTTAVPPTPTYFWIWPSMEQAKWWLINHPNDKICFTRVPDGYATHGCYDGLRFAQHRLR